jgi:hypothetical protein
VTLFSCRIRLSYVSILSRHMQKLIHALFKDIDNLAGSCPSRNPFTSKILNSIYFSSTRLGTCTTCLAPTTHDNSCYKEMFRDVYPRRTCRSYHASFLGQGVDMFLKLSEETRSLMGFPPLTLNGNTNRESLLSYSRFFVQEVEGGAGPILGITYLSLLAISRVFVLGQFPHTPWDASHMECFFGFNRFLLPAKVSLLPSSQPAAAKFRDEMLDLNEQFHCVSIDYTNPSSPFISSHEFPIDLPRQRVRNDEVSSTFPSTDTPPPYSVASGPQQMGMVASSSGPSTLSPSGRPIIITIVIPTANELPDDIVRILRAIEDSQTVQSALSNRQ